MSGDIQTQTAGHIGVVELCRPPHNYFDVALLAAVADSISAFDSDPQIRVVVLAAQGRSFCAGANFAPPPGDQRGFGGDQLYRHAERLFRTAKPIVAAVQGWAIGGGLGLAMAADFRVASPETKLAANFTAIGYHPGFGLTVTLPRVIGAQRAALLMATGRTVDGTQAAEMGLVDQLAPAAELREAAMAFAGELASVAPLALQATRATLRAGLADRVSEALANELAAQVRLRETHDFQEGVAARKDRRQPRFIGA